MSLSKTAEATRAVLKQHRDDAVNGKLTTDRVIELVRQVVPQANETGIFNAIEAYGPIGEGDMRWYHRAENPQYPGWFYNPRTGEPLQ